MNETTNLEIVRSGYEKFGSGDVPGLLELFTSDIKWSVPEVENAPFGGLRHGTEQVADFFQQLSSAEEITGFEPREFIAQNDRVVVLGRSEVTVRDTGRNYATDWVHVFRLKDGKVTEFLEFFDNAAATRAFQKTVAA